MSGFTKKKKWKEKENVNCENEEIVEKTLYIVPHFRYADRIKSIRKIKWLS